MPRLLINVTGIVQGVGFRPFVYNKARQLAIKGTVKNTSEGVIIDAEGDGVYELVESISKEPPPLALISGISTIELASVGYEEFTILHSGISGSFTLLSPDISICADCKRELFDNSDRRFQYPFINCTNCGPRYSITRQVPYDRANTTMSSFQMCSRCQGEYDNPEDRRFHAQPNACGTCGPSLSFEDSNPSLGPSEDLSPLQKAINMIHRGGIVAIKGLGGFHLCCNGEDEDAVSLLRSRKRKSNKPFALMLPDIDTVRSICETTKEEEALMSSKRRPIVLLKRLKITDAALKIAPSVAPNNRYLGCMLPYTPLHYLLFFYNSRQAIFNALVMTSGNRAEEPIVKDDDEARERLSEFVDGFLFHNREIFTALDDSVVRKASLAGISSEVFIRRARGYVPEPISIPCGGDDVLGAGADLKNAFALAKGKHVIMSQHIGDMGNNETLLFFEETLKNLSSVYNADIKSVGYDLHPDYMSSRWAERYAAEMGIKGFAIQHHHCHIASVMAEHGLEGKVIGVAFDGAGFGTDGNIWGSEFLICEETGFYRAASFDYIPLPGGDKASKECWRPALSLIRNNTKEDEYWHYVERLGFMERYGRHNIETITAMIDRNIMSPLSSGCGRLIDGVSSISGCCSYNTFEGESALALENLLDNLSLSAYGDSYNYNIKKNTDPNLPDYTIGFKDMIKQIIEDALSGCPAGIISMKFHNMLVDIVVRTVALLAEEHDIRQTALSGGVFQNLYLLSAVSSGLINRGLRVYFNRRVPSNDGGIALGQVYVARKQSEK